MLRYRNYDIPFQLELHAMHGRGAPQGLRWPGPAHFDQHGPPGPACLLALSNMRHDIHESAERYQPESFTTSSIGIFSSFTLGAGAEVNPGLKSSIREAPHIEAHISRVGAHGAHVLKIPPRGGADS